MGLDVHKDVIQYCIVTEKRLLEEAELKNTKGGLKKLVSIIKKRKVRSVAMESTSQYHVKVMYYFLESRFKNVLKNLDSKDKSYLDYITHLYSDSNPFFNKHRSYLSGFIKLSKKEDIKAGRKRHI